MRFIAFFGLCALCAFFSGKSFAKEVSIPFAATHVEIFPQGALIRLRAAIDLPKGEHTIHTILPASIAREDMPTLKSNANIRGLRLSPDRFFNLKEFDAPEVAQARARVEEAENAETALYDLYNQFELEFEAFEAKADLLKSIKGGDALPKGNELIELSGLVFKELTALAGLTRPLQDKMRDLEKQIEDASIVTELANAHLARLTDWTERAKQLSIDVKSSGEMVWLETQVFDPSASWKMRYEVNLLETGTGDRITMDRQVLISQGSGLPWLNTALTLSTAKPSGQITPTKVNRSIASVFSQDQISRSELRSVEPLMMMTPINEESRDETQLFQVNFEGPVVTYDLPQPVTVYGDASVNILSLSPLEFDANRYLAGAPRYDDTAFIAADIVNATGQPIFTGFANFLRDGALVGTGYLPAIADGAEGTLGFGPEVSVELDVEFLDKLTGDQGIIRSSSTRTEQVRVTVRNLSDEPRALVLRYAVPTSQQEALDIDIKLTPPPTKRDVDTKKGVMEWDVKLAPHETRDIMMVFSFKWPESQNLNWQP